MYNEYIQLTLLLALSVVTNMHTKYIQQCKKLYTRIWQCTSESKSYQNKEWSNNTQKISGSTIKEYRSVGLLQPNTLSTSAGNKQVYANKYMFMPHKSKLQIIRCLHKAGSEQQPRRSECHSSCLCDPLSDIKSQPDETEEAHLRGHI